NLWADGTVETEVNGPDPRWGMLAPLSQSDVIAVPGGPIYSNSVQRGVTLTNSTDPLSLAEWSETNLINGRTYVSAFAAATRTQTNTSPVGRRVFKTFDLLLRPLKIEFPGLAGAQYAYDSHGRLASQVLGSGPQARTNLLFYDNSGNLTNVTD